jgi:hypothetical protein
MGMKSSTTRAQRSGVSKKAVFLCKSAVTIKAFNQDLHAEELLFFVKTHLEDDEGM